MSITRLVLTDFRNHADALITPGAGFVILTGENGAGKTNILEAVSLLTPGRGLRGAALSAMARADGPGGFAVAARLLQKPLPLSGWVGVGPNHEDAPAARPRPPTPSPQGEGEVLLGTGTLATAPERRQVRINGAEASATGLSEWLALLWLTPAMDRLFVEGASGRRRFLDRLVLAREPSHAGHASRYEAAMRARNKLLAEPDGADPAWLTALEAGMAEHGAAIAEARTRTTSALAEQLVGQTAGPFARAGLSLTGWLPLSGDGQTALTLELKQGRGRDAAAGRTLAGPHRSDLTVTHLDKSMPAELCSTGEQKALLLGLILAHADGVEAQRGERPILLLDEVAAHLDPLRRAALFDRLDRTGGQVWMTGTEDEPFADAPATAARLHVGQNGVS